MRPTSKKVHAFALLELLLAIAVLALAIQLILALDFQNWSRGDWMIANAGVLTTLLAVRFLPDAIVDRWERRGRRMHDQDNLAARQKAKERREALEQIRQSRKRRMY